MSLRAPVAKTLMWTGVTLVVLVLLIAAFGVWLIKAPSGARWIASSASNWLGAKLEIGGVDGTIAGPLTLSNVRYRDPAAGIDVTASRISVDLAVNELASFLVRVHDADVRGVRVLLHEPTQPAAPPETSEPFTLESPIDLVVDRFAISNVSVSRDAAVIFELTRGLFVGRWTEADLAIKKLELRSPQGEVDFEGRVNQERTYVGEGRGRFRWRVGGEIYAGSLETVAEGEDVNLSLRLRQPLNARLEAFAEQTAAWPWRFTLEAPRFDPREALMPGSSFTSLAASLSGAGTLERGAIRGKLVINDEPLLIEPLRFARDPERMAFDAALRVGEEGGAVLAKGEMRFAEEAWRAQAEATWADVVLPAVWVGQELHTRGRLGYRGGAEEYEADGAVSLGPPKRIADIEFMLTGSPDAVRLSQLDVVQKDGRLDASGSVQFKPRLSWAVAANARGFDPGAFAAQWPGKLNFALESEGRVQEKGPSAKAKLTNLSGELRGRALSGQADLSIDPALVPAGTLQLRSGRSELSVDANSGEQIDARIVLNVASLNDWIPDGGGELRADFTVRGRWPALAIEGDARGRELNAFNVRMDALAIDANIKDPRNPQGAVDIDLSKLTAAGFEFDSVIARASGGPSAHTLTLDARGAPLAFEVGLKGERTQKGWVGDIAELGVDVADAAHLRLRSPVHVVAEAGAMEMSQLCLGDGEISLCAAGAMQPDASLEVNYSLANVPLGLANVFAASEAPLKFDGTVSGRGDVRRAANGELFGEATLESRSGSMTRHIAAIEGEAQAPQTLFTWRDVRLAASLAGADARATLSAVVLDKGEVRGEGAVRGLGEAESPVTARVTAHLPDLAPFAVFAPQVANVKGRADARINVAGTVQAPRISGEVTATELAADVPAVGLHLKNGRLAARPAESGEIAIEGAVESGEGRLTLAGAMTSDGAVELDVDGDRFLAADIPGARVIIAPNLQFVRAEERLKLTGEVLIPEATVDLQKLPRGGDRAPEASPDVVVIDAKTREDEVEEAPLYAEVTVMLGEKVELSGFGLQATLKGRLAVTERPGEPTVGSGEVLVAGRYKAYGQDLTIKQGRLLYAATPLDDPRLAIEAVRVVEEVTAGLRVRGSAKDPELTVFSDPPMAQANALSYLVAGKPLDAIGAEEGEGDALQTATRSLGTAAGGLLAKNLGRRLGVDDLAVKDDDMIGGAALTVGQYLSPRLYLSYGVGLFEPGEVVTLRFKLSEDLDVKAQRGPEDTRAGLEYRIER